MAIRQETIKIGSKEYNKIYSSEDKELSSLTNGAVYRAFYGVSSFNEDEFVEIDNGGSVGPSVLVDTYISNVSLPLFALLVDKDQIKENTVYLISSNNFSMYGNKITNLKDPIDISDAVNLNTLNVKYNELLNLIYKLCAEINNSSPEPTPPTDPEEPEPPITPDPEEPEPPITPDPEKPEPSIYDTILRYIGPKKEIKKISGKASWTNLGVKGSHIDKNDTLILVQLGKSVNSIDSYTFSWCYSLTSISIPDSVSSIGDYAFYCCSSLPSINIPSSVSSIVKDTFNGCRSLTSVTIPSSVIYIGQWAFLSCFSLPSINIPSSVTSIGDSAFLRCSSLTSINIPNSVTSIGTATFSSCYSLNSINIPNSVTSIESRAFSDCHSLTSVTIPNSVKSIKDYAFSDCSSLTSIVIPDSVTSIGNWAFEYCYSLNLVVIPKSVTSIGLYAFSNCSSLTSVYFRNRRKSLITSMVDYPWGITNPSAVIDPGIKY